MARIDVPSAGAAEESSPFLGADTVLTEAFGMMPKHHVTRVGHAINDTNRVQASRGAKKFG